MKQLPADPEQGDVTVSVPADDDTDPDAFTVHGILRRPPRRITLVDATSDGRGFTIGSSGADPGEQRLLAGYALIGPYVSGPEALFDRARFSVGHLDDWARLPGLETRVSHDGTQASIEYSDPEEERARVPDVGDLVLTTVLHAPLPTLRGVALAREAELRIELDEPRTFDYIWRQVVGPVATLMGLCADGVGRVSRLELRIDAAQPWVQVRHPSVEPDPAGLPNPGSTREQLFARDIVNLDHVARWLTLAPTLAPIPGIVAAVRTDSDRTLANQLLDLAVAAEGLHRRLEHQPRVMTKSAADAARRAARDAVDVAVRERVNEALGHLADPTYGERLRAITDLAADAIPDVMGRRELWEKRIKQVRNGFAHQLPASRSSDEWQEYLVLLRSLRWVLIAALLNRADVDTTAIGEHLDRYEPYRFQLRQARRWAPDLFPPIA